MKFFNRNKEDEKFKSLKRDFDCQVKECGKKQDIIRDLNKQIKFLNKEIKELKEKNAKLKDELIEKRLGVKDV